MPLVRPQMLLALLALASPAPLEARTTFPKGLILSGSITEGDSPNRFHQSIDLISGRTKRSQQMGGTESETGFDGSPWEQSNGIVMVSNLPLAVARERTRVWMDQWAWRERPTGGRWSRQVTPPGGNPVTLTFDRDSGLLKSATASEDWGPVTTRYSDWRRVGALRYPFHRESISPTGERTVLQIDKVQFVAALSKDSLTRPRWQSHAEPLGNGTAKIPYTAVGAKKSHILVDATINRTPAKLIFDTGAANYLTTESAPRFGVEITGGVNLSGVGEGSSNGGFATVKRIALGDAALRDETLVVGPSPFPPQNNNSGGADGFTGFEFLAEYVTTIDYPAHEIVFRSALPTATKARPIPFYNDGSHIYLRATIDGAEGYFGLDTGDGGTVAVFPAFAARNGLHGDGRDAKTTGGGIGGSVTTLPGVARRFSLGGLSFENLPVRFPQNKSGAFASRGLAGNLGGAVLQCFRITIDFPRHLLVLEPTPESPECAPGGTVSRS